MVELDLENIEPIRNKMALLSFLFAIIVVSNILLIAAGETGSEYRFLAIYGLLGFVFCFGLMIWMGRAKKRYKNYFTNKKVSDLRELSKEFKLMEFIVETELKWFLEEKTVENKQKIRTKHVYISGKSTDEVV